MAKWRPTLSQLMMLSYLVMQRLLAVSDTRKVATFGRLLTDCL